MGTLQRIPSAACVRIAMNGNPLWIDIVEEKFWLLCGRKGKQKSRCSFELQVHAALHTDGVVVSGDGGSVKFPCVFCGNSSYI